jgi:hypothetical protein
VTDYLGGPGGEEKYRRRVDKVVAIDDRHVRALSEIPLDVALPLDRATDT